MENTLRVFFDVCNKSVLYTFCMLSDKLFLFSNSQITRAIILFAVQSHIHIISLKNTSNNFLFWKRWSNSLQFCLFRRSDMNKLKEVKICSYGFGIPSIFMFWLWRRKKSESYYFHSNQSGRNQIPSESTDKSIFTLEWVLKYLRWQKKSISMGRVRFGWWDFGKVWGEEGLFGSVSTKYWIRWAI